MNGSSTQNPARGLGHWLKGLAMYGSGMSMDRRRRVYLYTTAGALLTIWAPVLLFVTLSPTSYTSKWSLIMPVVGAGQTVNLESIGQASANVSSPFSSSSVDPKVNYKAIATSKPVLQDAAARANMHESEFGEPRIKLVDLTSLINFEIKGGTAQEAQDKAYALYEALQQRLNDLRLDEFQRREHYTNESIRAYSEKLSDAQQKIVEFQLGAKIISLEQFNDVTLGIEASRRKIAEISARLRGLEARRERQRLALGLVEGEEELLLTLQQDASFQELLRLRAVAAGELSDLSARLGSRHFRVLEAQEKHNGLSRSLRQRATQLGMDRDLVDNRFEALSRDQVAAGSVESLAQTSIEIAGLAAELVALQAQIEVDKARLEEGIVDATTLEDLGRKQQVALAVFTTALAKVDLGRADNFSSYPMIQLLAAPTLPYKADTLGLVLAIVGGILGTFFCLTGLAVLWVRKPYLQKILKSE